MTEKLQIVSELLAIESLLSSAAEAMPAVKSLRTPQVEEGYQVLDKIRKDCDWLETELKRIDSANPEKPRERGYRDALREAKPARRECAGAPSAQPTPNILHENDGGSN